MALLMSPPGSCFALPNRTAGSAPGDATLCASSCAPTRCVQLGVALCASDGVLPPILYLLLRPGSRARRQARQAGDQIPRPSPGSAPVLRGALALVLRSIGAVDARCNYCALAADPAQR